MEDSSVTLSALVAAYNQKRGASLRVRGRSVLLLPSQMISKFFHSTISKTITHVKELLAVTLTRQPAPHSNLPPILAPPTHLPSAACTRRSVHVQPTGRAAHSAQEHDVDFIFLVGGFAESKALLHHVRNELETDRRRVVVPARPGLAVLKGAMLLGLGASDRFASRVAR